MAITGHKNVEEIETYVQAANRQGTSRDAMAKIETATPIGT
jgi:hypothetical protein